MKDHLGSFQPDLLTDSIKASSETLGNYALQTPSCILWVRGCIFVSIDSGTTSLSISEEGTDSQSPAIKYLLILSAGGAPTIRSIAQNIDRYIATHTAASGFQPKPNPVLSPTFPTTITTGQQVVLKLDNVKDTHVIKRATVKHPGLVCQVSNGTEDGQYPMFARRPGRTSIKFTLAHAKILSVHSIDAPITIVAETGN